MPLWPTGSYVTTPRMAVRNYAHPVGRRANRPIVDLLTPWRHGNGRVNRNSRRFLLPTFTETRFRRSEPLFGSGPQSFPQVVDQSVHMLRGAFHTTRPVIPRPCGRPASGAPRTGRTVSSRAYVRDPTGCTVGTPPALSSCARPGDALWESRPRGVSGFRGWSLVPSRVGRGGQGQPRRGVVSEYR